MLNPGALPSDQPGTFAEHEAGPPTIPEVPGEDQAAERESPGDRFRPVASEVVEEYIEE